MREYFMLLSTTIMEKYNSIIKHNTNNVDRFVIANQIPICLLLMVQALCSYICKQIIVAK